MKKCIIKKLLLNQIILLFILIFIPSCVVKKVYITSNSFSDESISNGFFKKTRATDNLEIEKAINCMKEYLGRS